MLLALDVGNTNITVGAFEGSRLLRLWRLATDVKKTADEYGSLLASLTLHAGGGAVTEAVFGSVVDAVNPALRAAIKKYLAVEPLAIASAVSLPLKLRVDHPEEVGVDRALNALAAVESAGAPCIVIDFGTATTFDCVSARGEYIGGAILIGPKLASAALALYTAKLPEVELARPARVIGKNTVSCIQAGLYHGYLGMLQRVLELTLKEMRATSKKRIRIIATGGLAGLFYKELKGVDSYIPELTLQGLRLAHEALSVRA